MMTIIITANTHAFYVDDATSKRYAFLMLTAQKQILTHFFVDNATANRHSFLMLAVQKQIYVQF